MTETIVAPATRTANRYEIRLLLVPFLSLGFAFFDRQILSLLAPYTDKDFGLANAGLPEQSVGGALVAGALPRAEGDGACRRIPPGGRGGRMRAGVWYGAKDVRVETVPVTPPGPGAVTIEVAFCGICGSDLHEYADGPHAVPVGDPHPESGVTAPLILGYEPLHR